MNLKYILKYLGLFLIFVIFLLWTTRFILPSQVDDVNPLMGCTDDVLDLGDVYFIVPKFKEVEISKEWCEEISSGDKELAIHGVYHTYEEFGVFRNESYFYDGVDVFEECFGFVPYRFKPGQLKWTDENDWIKKDFKVDLFWNQVFHKVYHCGDDGLFPNWFIRIF